MRMMQCPSRLGLLWQKGRKDVGLFLPRTKGGTVDPKGKMGHWSARTKITREESEEPKGAENAKQEKEK